ncbi:MAG: hypothetical protein J6D16_00015 [Clostridia bacterium]|nr:hypothetical protein [Clostridia bacterium]
MATITFGKRVQVTYDTETFGFCATKEGVTFRTADFEPYLLLKDGKRVPLRAAASQNTVAYPSGVGEGVLTTLSDFPGLDLSLSLYVWLEEINGRLHTELIPLREAYETVAEVCWPAPIHSFDRERGYSVVNLSNGRLYPDNYEGEIHTEEQKRLLTRGCYLAFWGQVTGEGGYLAGVATPWDADYAYDKADGEPMRIGIHWIPSLGKIRSRREMFFDLFAGACDYNTICLSYRDYLREIGKLVSLKEKIDKNPIVGKMIGRPVIHTSSIRTHRKPGTNGYRPDQPEKNDQVTPFSVMTERLEALHKKGVKAAYVHVDGWGRMGYDNMHPDILPPCPEAGGYEGMRDMVERLRAIDFIPAVHDNYRDYYTDAETYNENQAQVHHDGSFVWQDCWAGGMQRKLCAKLALPYIRRNYTRLKQEGACPDGVYIDVFSITKLDECDHPMHRMTRKECQEERCKGLEYIRAEGMIISSEEPVDFTVASLDLVHHAFDCSDGKTRGIPVPLFELVYHDNLFVPCSLSTNAAAPFKNNGFLRALLHGNLPYVGMYADEAQIAKAELVCRVNRAVALSPMVRHRFIGKGYAVQESEFENGVRVRIDLDAASYEIRWADGTVTAGTEQNVTLEKNNYAYAKLDT